MVAMRDEILRQATEGYVELSREGGVGLNFDEYAAALDGSPLPETPLASECDGAFFYTLSFEARTEFIRRFSFAIPNEKALEAIARLSPLVEIGAGTGYWAALLARRGADIVCTGERVVDDSYNQSIGRYHPVKKVGEAGLCYLINRNAFLCWPPYDCDLAYRVALRVRPRRYLAVIGEGDGGCTGDDQFHGYVREAFDQVEVIAIPQWYGLHDFLAIYRKSRKEGLG